MRLTFATTARQLTAADHLLVIAPARRFGRRAGGSAAFARWCDAPRVALIAALGRGTQPGLLGAVGNGLAADGRRVSVGVLADAVSRHAGPARAEAIHKVVGETRLDRGGRIAVLVVLDDPAHALAAANAIGRALPLFMRKSGRQRPGSVAVLCTLADGTPVPPAAADRDVVHAARRAAELVDTPPSELDPAALAATAGRLLRTVRGVRVRQLTGPMLLRQRLAGIHAVGRQAKAAPRLVIATIGAGHRPHVALVGKGVTYDTGGLHLKARGAMESMKSDMGGAAAVLGAFLVLARHRLPIRLSLLLCLAENAIGPLAYKPDDVLTLHSGKTVEINNTDAEGRILLADGCSYAVRVLGADVVLDAATLTGAQGIATGSRHAAVISNDERVESALLAAGRATGDLCWPLPFAPEFYRGEFHSPVADMRNSVKDRSNAQVSCAAEFIHWHIADTGARWGHVDLAFPAFRGDRGTGFGVALLVEAVRQIAGNG